MKTRLHSHRCFLRPPKWMELCVMGLTSLCFGPQAIAQVQDAPTPGGVISVAVGNSTLLVRPEALRRVSIADPGVADAVILSRREILVNGKAIGTTSLLVWDTAGDRELYSVEVTADAAALERQLQRLFPDEQLSVDATGNTLVLSGRVSRVGIAELAIEIAGATGAGVVNNIAVPAPHQVMLQVRFAEVSRTALEEFGANLLRIDPLNLRGDEEVGISTGRRTPFSGDLLSRSGPEQTFSDAVNLFLFHPDAQVGVFIRALKTRGLFRSLAEPNLLALDGKQASFLAGGEFPFPVVQGGAQTNAVTITFKEFGVRLNFTPTVTNSGSIRLKVAPEVSTLDFANSLLSSGFRIPSILTRRAETEIELMDGQSFAIAGLIDNSITDNLDKVPILGDIPILGQLFRSKDLRQNRTELLVLVTPQLVEPAESPPRIPTGEPATWEWDKWLRDSDRSGVPEDRD